MTKVIRSFVADIWVMRIFSLPRRRCLVTSSFLLFSIFLSPPVIRHSPLLAQSTSAAITGMISDPTKAVIGGALVRAINTGTNVQYGTVSNSKGAYVITNIPPGNYRIEVEKQGFKSIVKPDVELHIQDALEINFEMQLGPTTEIITVQGGGINMNTTDGTVSTLVDAKTVENMPLNGRSFQDLILLTPGVVTTSPQANATLGEAGEFSVNGQRTDANYYTVDGVAANVSAAPGGSAAATFYGGASGSFGAATALGTTQALVSVDDLQEFRVQSSSYSAEYGRNPGGQFAFETKSGTNQWHGDAFDYLRNGDFDAPDWFTDYYGRSQPALRQNDFGGTLGGPVRIPHVYNGKDKTFFFVSYEGLRATFPQAAEQFFVPDQCMRNVSGACAAINSQYGLSRAPAYNALLPVVNAFPVPNVAQNFAQVQNGFAEYVGSWTVPASINATSVRLDQVVSNKMTLFFRFSNTNSNEQARPTVATGLGQTPSEVEETPYLTRTYTAGINYIFTNRLSDSFRLNYTSTGAAPNILPSSFGGSAPTNLGQLLGFPNGATVTPQVLFVLGGNQIRLIQASGIANEQSQWNFVDTVNYSVGAHQFKFGADYRRLTPFNVPGALVNYNYTGGEPQVESGSARPAFAVNMGSAYPLYQNFGAFAQDNWKVSSRLTLSLGLRWDVNPAPGITQGTFPYTIQGTNQSNWSLAPYGTPLWKTTWFNFAPRLGVAYILRNTSGWETVLRSGGGVFFDTGQQLGSIGFSGPGISAAALLSSFQFPASCTPAPCSVALQVPKVQNPISGVQSNIYGFNPHLQLPYTLQWNVSLEQQLGKSQALTLSYIGSHGGRLLQEDQYGGNANAGSFVIGQNGLTSNYDAFQVQFQRTLAHGLTVLGSYTWSHCIDYGSVNILIAYQRGNCDYDVRHNVSAAFSYDLPNVSGNGVVRAVLDHWGVDDRFTARTAFPVFLVGNTVLNATTEQAYAASYDSIPGQPLYLYGTNCNTVLRGLGDLAASGPGSTCPGGKAINPCAFYEVGVGANQGCNANQTLGPLAPRNQLRGFGEIQMDLAIRREFPIYERMELQFRAEAFNIFNHPDFGLISTAGSNFGQVTESLASSLGVMNPTYQMGGPRSMQFALKLIF